MKKGCDFKKIDEQAGVFDVLAMISMLVACVVIASSLSGCSNWQGMEFKVGIGTYNGATETKTYTKEEK